VDRGGRDANSVAVADAAADAAPVAAVVVRDAAVVATVPHDAAVVATVPHDAAVVASDAAGAAVVATVPRDAAVVRDAAGAAPTDDIRRAWHERRFADAVAACRASEAARAAHGVECASAACRAGDMATATTWMAPLSHADRGMVRARCPRLTKPTPQDAGAIDCTADPMACRQ
jgi:hypothetical protein